MPNTYRRNRSTASASVPVDDACRERPGTPSLFVDAAPLRRVSCDSVVARGESSEHGTTIFAKNSDRPAQECHPLLQLAAADHQAGSRLRCQYVEIEQVAHTNAFIGASPYWLWGLEHGLNEYGVAIGNHTIFTKDPVADTGLLGMDLVRLGLERAVSARGALQVIIDLIERYGQGGSGAADTHWPYHNSFLIADASEALLLEASAKHWALRELPNGGSASNHTTIGSDWDRLSDGCIAHAREMGWFDGADEDFDFAAAYRDYDTIPPVISSGRYAATCAALGRNGSGGSTGLGVEDFKRLMRDHYDGGEVYLPGPAPDDEKYFSVCMHADPVGTTTASMVVELHGDPGRPLIYWAALGNPCVGPYLPVFADAELPAALCKGSAEPDPASAWWSFKELLDAVSEDFAVHGPVVRAFWRDFEAGLSSDLEDLLAAGGLGTTARARFAAQSWERTERARAEILARIKQS